MTNYQHGFRDTYITTLDYAIQEQLNRLQRQVNPPLIPTDPFTEFLLSPTPPRLRSTPHYFSHWVPEGRYGEREEGYRKSILPRLVNAFKHWRRRRFTVIDFTPVNDRMGVIYVYGSPSMILDRDLRRVTRLYIPELSEEQAKIARLHYRSLGLPMYYKKGVTRLVTPFGKRELQIGRWYDVSLADISFGKDYEAATGLSSKTPNKTRFASDYMFHWWYAREQMYASADPQQLSLEFEPPPAPAPRSGINIPAPNTYTVLTGYGNTQMYYTIPTTTQLDPMWFTTISTTI